MNPPPPYSPYAAQMPQAARTDPKAVVSLVLGILSIFSVFCYIGFLFGIPAVIVGIVSRQSIARSSGEVGGGGLAIAGAVTGGVGTALSLGYIALLVGLFTLMGTTHSPHPGPIGPLPTAPPAPTATVSAGAGALTSAHVRFLSPSDGPLDKQLEAAYAESGKLRLVAVTAATWSKESIEVIRAIDDAELQRVLATCDVVGVDVDAFKGELAASAMDRPGVPWFFVVGASGAAIDALSADAWGSNDAHTIAPVLRAFLSHRRPSGAGKPGTHM